MTRCFSWIPQMMRRKTRRRINRVHDIVAYREGVVANAHHTCACLEPPPPSIPAPCMHAARGRQRPRHPVIHASSRPVHARHLLLANGRGPCLRTPLPPWLALPIAGWCPSSLGCPTCEKAATRCRAWPMSWARVEGLTPSSCSGTPLLRRRVTLRCRFLRASLCHGR